MRKVTTCVSTSAATVVIKQSKSKCMAATAFTSAPANHAKTEWRRAINLGCRPSVSDVKQLDRRLIQALQFFGLILRRLELGEFFFRVGYVGFVRTPELKQSLLTPQVRFGKFKLGTLAFCYGFLLGLDQLRERCFRHFQLLFCGVPRRNAGFLLGDCSFGLSDSRACQFSFALDCLQRSLLHLNFREHSDLPQPLSPGRISFRTL